MASHSNETGWHIKNAAKPCCATFFDITNRKQSTEVRRNTVNSLIPTCPFLQCKLLYALSARSKMEQLPIQRSPRFWCVDCTA